MKKENKRMAIVFASILALLCIPAIAMQFTDEVNWGPGDFVIMGLLLVVTGLMAELIIRKVRSTQNRILVLMIVGFLFLLTWAELAVGIFGTPFAGS